LTSIVQSGELQAEIGAEGFAEALRRRWVVPDYAETGALQVTNLAAQIQEIEAVAAAGAKPGVAGPGDQKLAVGDSVTVADGGKVVVGVVKEIRPDGRVVVSFGEQRPASGRNDFAPTELKKNEADKPAGTEPPPAGTAHP
jgi:biotin-(acetyl-CoA carboxylase) ligase